MLKSFKMGIMLILVCTLSACGITDTNEDDTVLYEFCFGDQQKCDGDYVMICVNDVWEKNSKPCPDGCIAGKCMTPDLNIECKNDERQCDGDVLQKCVNREWVDVEKCTNGCDSFLKMCNPVSETPVETPPSNPPANPPAKECEDDEVKCLGDYILVCKNGFWENQEKCEYGCEANKCIEKSDAKDPNSYCVGQVLHRWISNKEFKTDCSHKGLECQLLKDGKSACVFVHETVKEDCQKDNQIVNAKCENPKDIGVTDGEYPYIAIRRCATNSKGVLVGIADDVWSLCGNLNGEDVVLMCDSDVSTLKKKNCSDCKNEGLVASCGGTKQYPPKIGSTPGGEDDGTMDLSILFDSYKYCGKEKDGKYTLDEVCAVDNRVAICSEDLVNKFCFEPCTSEGKTKSICEETREKGRYWYVTNKCIQIENKMVFAPYNAKICESTCNATNTDCK